MYRGGNDLSDVRAILQKTLVRRPDRMPITLAYSGLAARNFLQDVTPY